MRRALVALLLLAPGAARAQLAEVGLSTVRAQLSTHFGFVDVPVDSGSSYGAALAAGDFDGDGADDLAAGIPGADGADGNAPENAGVVAVRFGVRGRGLEPEPNLFLAQGSLGSLREAGDRHGATLVSCDFDGDGFDDLAIGAPDEDSTAPGNGSGAVHVHYGSANAAVFQQAGSIYTQETPGVANQSEPGDRFGETLACGDFDGDGFADLVVGAPSESIGSAVAAGMVHLLPGTQFGVAGADLAFDQNTIGIEGTAESDDRFGSAFAVGRFDGDAFDDLAIGVYGESCGSLALCGVIQILFGSVNGLSTIDDQLFSDGSFGGAEESGDLFGFALAAGDFDGDGFDDLVAGAPLESLGAHGWTGAVIEAKGSSSGITAAGSRVWDQNALGLLDTNEANDFFGWALAVGDFDRDGLDDVVAGHPGESHIAAASGALTVARGAAGVGLQPEPNRSRELYPGWYGVPGGFVDGRALGEVLVTGDFDGDGHADLAVGVPDEPVATFVDAGAVLVIYGALFADGFDSESTLFWSGGEN